MKRYKMWDAREEESPAGTWVHLDDIADLERENEALRQHNQHLEDVVSAYVDTVGGVNESAYQSVKADRLAREAGE